MPSQGGVLVAILVVLLSEVVGDQFFNPLPGEEESDVHSEIYAPAHRGENIKSAASWVYGNIISSVYASCSRRRFGVQDRRIRRSRHWAM
jgi:hypothetical protein